MIVIPAIDLIAGKCVRLYQGDYSRQTSYSENPVEQALKFQAARFARLHVVDLEGARTGSCVNRDAAGEIVRAVAIPVQVGGGIRESETVRRLLESGASYLILSTVAIQDPGKVSDWIGQWGAGRFIISLDLRGGKLQRQGWTEEASIALEAMIDRCRSWGVSQLICTDVERDGTLAQPNYATYSSLVRLAPSETFLIAAGGISRTEHLSRLHDLGVGAAIVGRALYEGNIPWEEIVSVG